jgi:hypothetical protein
VEADQVPPGPWYQRRLWSRHSPRSATGGRRAGSTHGTAIRLAFHWQRNRPRASHPPPAK